MEKRIKKIINLTTLNKPSIFFIMYPFQINVLPAYGRDYKNKKEILKDYLENKDFQVSDITNHPYLNKRRYIFCCTFPKLTLARSYLVFFPVEPGISS